MNKNKEIALQIVSFDRAEKSPKELAEKYCEVLDTLDNHSGSKGCTGVAIGGTSDGVRKLTKIEVITRALRDAGFFIVDYKSNYDGARSLTGLVIAPLKD